MNSGFGSSFAEGGSHSSGSSGEVTPLKTREVNSMTCRETRIVNRAQGLNATGEYLLCKAADGEWTIGGSTN